MKKHFILGFAAIVSVNALANDNIKYTCTNNEAERVIEVVYTTPDQAVPCEIHYTKDGQTQTLWTFSNEAGACEIKAEEFVAKQSGWGWQCGTGDTEKAE